MDRERNNKINSLVHYIESYGVTVNLAKNTARGNKGLFFFKNNKYRIDISRNNSNDCILSTLLHEFAHFIHYKYDSSLKHLDFIFNKLTDEEYNELLNITIEKVPQEFANSLYTAKETLLKENKELVKNIKKQFPDYKASIRYTAFEKDLPIQLKYLLKYDRVKIFNNILTLDSLNNYNISSEQLAYFKIKSNKRKISRINSKICRLNKYYTQPSELWARFFELYYTDNNLTQKLAPKIFHKYQLIEKTKKIPEIYNMPIQAASFKSL